MSRPFKGIIKTDIRDSTPDWEPYIPPKAPEGAPNVLIVLYDDTGLAAWSPFGGRIRMPTLERLADNGLMYSQWHTTALCSPTRSCFLTGRNHHQNGMACITEASTGFPGSHGHIPPECGTLAEVMRQAGWSTFWLGKNHNVPVEETHAGAPKSNWPLHQGWDRFYGFLGGETNNWYPTLIEDNRLIDQPYQPEEGYHLSKDLADNAIQMIRDVKVSAPSRPWFTWFCPGANHAPHHVSKEWADKYKGQFDDGYEAYREWALGRMIEKGVMPEGTELTPLNPMPEGTYSPNDDVRPWESLSDEEKKLFARMAEVFAGFSEYTDHQVGRIVDYLEESGQLENTIIIYCADNGASGEGTPERLGQRESVLQRLARRHRGKPQAHRRPRQPDHVQPLSDRLGCCVLDAVQDVQAVLVRRWDLRPARDPLAGGHQGQGRGPPPVPPRHGHRPDDPRVLRPGVSEHAERARASATGGRVDALLVRRGGCAYREEAPVLRDARHAWHLGPGLEGGRGSRSALWNRQLRP